MQDIFPIVFTIHLFSCFFMTGLCWFVQVIHYPLFREIKLEDFPKYERKNFITAYLSTPVMLVEMFTALWMLYPGFSPFHIINVVLFGITGFSTFIFSVPTHLKLADIATEKLITRVIRTNWIRTICWTIRSVMLSVILVRFFYHAFAGNY